MIIAIDESGPFASSSSTVDVFVAVQIRQRKTMLRQKQQAFMDWEGALPESVRDAKREVKGSALNDRQLTEFVQRVLMFQPAAVVTAIGIRPKDTSTTIIEKHRQVLLKGARYGVQLYGDQGKKELSATYRGFEHWLQKLSFVLFTKITVLGECIGRSLENAFGHSISGGYDAELPRLHFMIDRDFVRDEQTDLYWHELLRNQLYHVSQRHPVPTLKTWEKHGHPVLVKYARDGQFDMNELFRKNLEFAESHQSPVIRMADFTASIVRRAINGRGCERAYSLARTCLAADKRIPVLELEDFDLERHEYDPSASPWASN